MQLNFKGSGFTAKSGTSLCDTCEHCHKVEGAKLQDVHTICSYSRDFPIHFPVINCTKYSQRGRMSLHKMYEEAWELAKDKRTGQIGFYSKNDMKRLEDRVNRLGKDIDPYAE